MMKRIKAKEDLFKKLQELDEKRADLCIQSENGDLDLKESFLELDTFNPD